MHIMKFYLQIETDTHLTSVYCCRQMVLSVLASRTPTEKLAIIIPNYKLFKLTSGIKNRLINFCLEHKYSEPQFDENEKVIRILVDSNLAKKGFVIHYFIGLLQNFPSENKLYNKYIRCFDNDLELNNFYLSFYSTVSYVLGTKKFRGFSQTYIGELKALCQKTTISQ